MSDFNTGKVAVVGLGLIGGSFCKALKAYTECFVYGSDHDEAVLDAALAYGAVDERLTEAHLAECGLVVCALYPADTLAFLRAARQHLRPGCVVLDTCGVKGAVCKEARDLLSGTGAVFLGGHPMAGKELSGFAASGKDLFSGASMVLTPAPDMDRALLSSVSEFIKRLGFQQIIDTTPEFHDKMIAYTSQLPHVVASSYVKSPNCRYHLGFTGGSFEDMSRVARMNARMWTELFLLNREPLAAEIETLCQNLSALREALLAQDAKQLLAMLEEGSRIKESLTEAQAK